jgi:hypothetical protein
MTNVIDYTAFKRWIYENYEKKRENMRHTKRLSKSKIRVYESRIYSKAITLSKILRNINRSLYIQNCRMSTESFFLWDFYKLIRFQNMIHLFLKRDNLMGYKKTSEDQREWSADRAEGNSRHINNGVLCI